MQTYGFEGVDWDWEVCKAHPDIPWSFEQLANMITSQYPVKDGGRWTDTSKFISLVKEFRAVNSSYGWLT